MPSNILAADVLFPHLTAEQSTDEKFTVVTDYLYMLLEQLRYTLANLGQENFNATELDNIGKVIMEPVYVKLQNLEGQMTSLAVTSEGLTAAVAGVAGSVTQLSMTVRGMSLSVVNGEQFSEISLMQDGVAISSQAVQITGMVTFASLSGSGKSIINGDNIKTGTISAINVNGCTITGSTLNAVMDAYGYINGDLRMYYGDVVDYFLAGGVKLELGDTADGNARARMVVYTNSLVGEAVALKLRANGGASLESETANVYLGAATIIGIQAPIISLWGDVYINNQLVYKA